MLSRFACTYLTPPSGSDISFIHPGGGIHPLIHHITSSRHHITNNKLQITNVLARCAFSAFAHFPAVL